MVLWACGSCNSLKPQHGAFELREAAWSCLKGTFTMGTAMAIHERNDPTNCIRIAPGVRLGKNVTIHCFVNLYGCEVGDESRVGAFVEIQKNVVIGARCKISSHSFLCEGVQIEDEV